MRLWKVGRSHEFTSNTHNNNKHHNGNHLHMVWQLKRLQGQTI
jgi:hypothetical protein